VLGGRNAAPRRLRRLLVHRQPVLSRARADYVLATLWKKGSAVAKPFRVEALVSCVNEITA
jgi:hypothetical protein